MRSSFGLYGRTETERERDRGGARKPCGDCGGLPMFIKESESGERSCLGVNEWRDETSEVESGESSCEGENEWRDETSEGVLEDSSPSSFVSLLFELEDAILETLVVQARLNELKVLP